LSKIALNGNANGSGTFTIASPNSNSDRTLDLPDAGGTVFVSGQALSATTGSFSGNVTLGSSVLATPTGSAPAYLCRAWVTFNGMGTVAISGSGNVSSVTDNGTGSYTVNFTTAMSDANYCTNATSRATSGAGDIAQSGVPTTSSVGIASYRSDGPPYDVESLHVAIFR
jgi:hypothetical protein